MGKFERDIKKLMKKDTEKFEIWVEENQGKLNGFSVERKEPEQINSEGTITKSRRIWLPVLACIGCVIICLTILLSVLLLKERSDFDMTFGEDEVYVAQISNEQKQDILEEYTFLNKMQIVAFDELRMIDNNSLVFTIIDGELETESDYYFLKVQIEHNKNYEFLFKSAYRGLKNEITVGNWKVAYGQGGNDSNDLYVYYLRLQDNFGKVIYIEVHCFENDISYILNEFI